MKKIMVVDDDRHIAELISLYFEADGFKVVSFETGEAAVENYAKEKPDAILLDVMLPGINGFDVVKYIRHRSSVPILMLTAKGDITDRVVGLQVGADDYIEKPFEPKELIARVQAVIRRAEGRLVPDEGLYGDKLDDAESDEDLSPQEYRENDTADEDNGVVVRSNLKVDMNSYIATINDEHIEMPPKELELLYFLAKHPNVVFNREELLERVWHNSAGESGSRTIDVHIKRIREKFPDELHPDWSISTVWGRGYIFKTDEI